MTEIEILTIPEALEHIGKMFNCFMHPERVFKNKLKKMGIKTINGTLTAHQLEEFIERCYISENAANTITSMERSVSAIKRRKSPNTLAAVIASKKRKNTQVV